MKNKFLIVLLVISTLPVLVAGQDVFKVKNSTYSFKLQEQDGKCVLNYAKGKNAKQLILDVSPNCKVIRMGATKKIIQHYYSDIKSIVIMVGGGLRNGNCKEEAADSTQTILIGRNAVRLGSQREGTCLPDGPDEKEYWLGSH